MLAISTHIYSYLIIQEVFLAFGQIFVWIMCLHYPSLYPVFILGALVSIMQVFATKNISNRMKKSDDQDLTRVEADEYDIEQQ